MLRLVGISKGLSESFIANSIRLMRVAKILVNENGDGYQALEAVLVLF